MNNTNSNYINDWLILLGVVFLFVFIVYILRIALWRIYRMFSPRKTANVTTVDMTNVLHLKKMNRMH